MKDKLKNFFKNKYTLYIGIAIFVLIVASISYYIYAESRSDSALAPYILPSLSQSYSNSIYNFSLKIPEDFKVRESEVDGSYTVVFENAKGEGVQILISKYDNPTTKILTAEMIQTEIPDLKITDPQSVEIGASYKGVAFKSDNEAFSGASREVWFIFKGDLYQISTYERFDKLLQGMFGTWEFK